MCKRKLIILQGIPASGKSTWAKKQALKDPKGTVIVNRDAIRQMLGQYWVPDREPLVTDIERAMIKAAADNCYTILLDATNLNPKALRDFKHLAKRLELEIEYKEFVVPVWKAIFRDWLRWLKGEKRVGAKVIRSFHRRYYVKPKP